MRPQQASDSPTPGMHKAAAMTLAHHYHAAQALSPKAARMATRLLDGSKGIPFEWRLSLRMALVERGRFAGPFTTTDLAPLMPLEAKAQDDGPLHMKAHAAQDADTRPQAQARRFIHAVENDPEAGKAE
jgi:hypothetical protein